MAQQPIWMTNTQWRETGRHIKIGPLDGRLIIFIVLWLLFPSKFLFILIILAITFFYGLEYIGYTLPNAIRRFKVLVSGKHKNGVHYWRQHKFKY